jgi:hypothetical protein
VSNWISWLNSNSVTPQIAKYENGLIKIVNPIIATNPSATTLPTASALSSSKLPPPPPPPPSNALVPASTTASALSSSTVSVDETTRVRTLIDKYKKNTDGRKGLPNSTTTSSGVSQTNACYINAMLQMLIDIDEFLEYILFMNETIKQQELNKINTNIQELLNQFSTVVGTTDNLPEFLIFVYNFLKTDDQPIVNNVNEIQQIIDSLNPKNSDVETALLRIGNIYCPFKFTSIHINKNVVCPKHKDNKNVGKSMLVSFGDYDGCNIVIEDKMYDANLKPIIFNGAELEHWNTNDLVGDKYSLVYFNGELSN